MLFMTRCLSRSNTPKCWQTNEPAGKRTLSVSLFYVAFHRFPENTDPMVRSARYFGRRNRGLGVLLRWRSGLKARTDFVSMRMISPMTMSSLIVVDELNAKILPILGVATPLRFAFHSPVFSKKFRSFVRLEKAPHECPEKERNSSLGPVLGSELCHYAAITALFPCLGATGRTTGLAGGAWGIRTLDGTFCSVFAMSVRYQNRIRTLSPFSRRKETSTRDP